MEKRWRDLIPAIFAKRDLDDICKSEAIEYRADSVSNVEHQHSQPAVHFIRAGAARIGCLAHAPDRRERAVNQPNDGAKFYPPHRACERVTAELSPSAFDISGRLELHKNLLEKFDWQFFFCRELTYLQHGPTEFGSDSEID